MDADQVTVLGHHEHAPAARPNYLAWGPVLGGAVVAMAMWMLLQLLGVAVGLTTVDVDSASSVKGAAIGTGIWGLAAPIVGFFVGGLVVGRTCHAWTKLDSAISGIVAWGLGAIVGMLAIGSITATVVGGAASAGSSAVHAAGAVVAKTASGVVGQRDNIEDLIGSFGINSTDALQPVNARLQAAGKPPVTAAQVEAAVKDVAGDVVRTGKLDRAMLVRSVADKTALSQADAEDVATRVQAQYERARTQVEQRLGEAKTAAIHAAQTAADSTGKVVLGLVVAMLLAMLAAALGAVLGARASYRRVEAPRAYVANQ